RRICDGLHESEGHEEREDRGARGDAEHLRTEEREQRSLRSDHGADERVHDAQEGELFPVSPETGRERRINQERASSRHPAGGPTAVWFIVPPWGAPMSRSG